MKKKYSIIILTCCILLIAGVGYSCSFKGNNPSTELVASLQETSLQDKEKQNSVNNKTSTQQSNENKNTDRKYNSDHDTGGSLSSARQNDKSVKSQAQEKKTWIYVHICGAVKKPGVYRAEEGTRLFTFIDMAGGFTQKADNHYVNQAQMVTDGQKIYIPTKAEVKDFVLTGDIAADDRSNQGKALNAEQGNLVEAGQGNSQSTEQGNTKKNGLVNINEASSEELMELPGIGQAKADKIIEYRKTKGGFNKIEDIMNITGIKEGLFSKISPYISVNN